MNRIIIWLASIVLSGAGSYIFKGCETKDEIKDLEQNVKTLNKELEQTTNALNDSLEAKNHQLKLVTLDNVRLLQLDSANKFFIAAKEKVLFDMRNLYLDANTRITDLNYKLAACETWKTDAADGIIIQKDTVRVKKRLFGGYKILD